MYTRRNTESIRTLPRRNLNPRLSFERAYFVLNRSHGSDALRSSRELPAASSKITAAELFSGRAFEVEEQAMA